jgi:hypothetical protein
LENWEYIAVVLVAVAAWLALLRMTPSQKKIEVVGAAIWKRYDKEQDAVNYMHREVDRQINKVRGVLTFDGLLLVIFRIDLSKADHFLQVLSGAALLYILISVAISLGIFLVHWGDLGYYATFNGEFNFKAKVVGTRTRYINFAVTLSGLSALAVAVVVTLQFLPSILRG